MLDEKLKIKHYLDDRQTKEYFIGIYTRLGKYKTPPTWDEIKDRSYLEAMLFLIQNEAELNHQERKRAYYGKSKRTTRTF